MPLTDHEERVLEALGKEFMQPAIVQGKDWLDVTNSCGESTLFPDDCPPDLAEDDTVEKVSGWFWRLSAPGYMDATEWNGPCDSEEEAARDLIHMYGDSVDLDEEEEV